MWDCDERVFYKKWTFRCFPLPIIAVRVSCELSCACNLRATIWLYILSIRFLDIGSPGNMASRHEASEVFLFEDIIYVALGTDVRECKSILLWAVQNSGGKRICILHVHQPPQLIPFSMSQNLHLSLSLSLSLSLYIYIYIYVYIVCMFSYEHIYNNTNTLTHTYICLNMFYVYKNMEVLW